MRRSLRLFSVVTLALAFTACGEAPMKVPRPNGTLDGAPSKAAMFPSGDWTDDYGNLWKATVADRQVEAGGACGPGLGLTLAGEIVDTRLNYRISTADGAVLAHGHADLINDGHAFFDTRWMDGASNAEGVLHFSHPSPVIAGRPLACAEGQSPLQETTPESADDAGPIELQPDPPAANNNAQ